MYALTGDGRTLVESVLAQVARARSAMSEPVRLLRPLVVADARGERHRLERRARLLAWGGIGWHVVEFAIALGAASPRARSP